MHRISCRAFRVLLVPVALLLLALGLAPGCATSGENGAGPGEAQALGLAPGGAPGAEPGAAAGETSGAAQGDAAASQNGEALPATEEDAAPPPAEEELALAGKALPPDKAPWPGLIARLTAQGHDAAALRTLYARPEAIYDPGVMAHKMRSLYEIKYKDMLHSRVQERLAALGWYDGPLDGLIGDQTMAAIRAFQFHRGVRVSGWPSWRLLELLDSTSEKAPPGFFIPPPVREAPVDTRPVYSKALIPERIAEGVALYNSRRLLFKKVQEKYDVPPEAILGILNVETRYGKVLGKHNAFVALSSMAATTTWEALAPGLGGRAVSSDQREWLVMRMGQKADWAFDELAALLVYARKGGRDPLAMPGSVYGAIGLCQFMPTSAMKLGADGDGDGKIDLFSLDDAVHSIARYLKSSGWRNGKKFAAARRKAVWHYNHSDIYVNTVLATADLLRPKLH